MKNDAKYALGMAVSLMRGRVSYSKNPRHFPEYYDMKEIGDDWLTHKRYWSTKKHYAFVNKMTMFGVTHASIIDNWLTLGFRVEKEFECLMKSIEHTARH